jgi:DNA invertase Pin-like site-specific DNA recombinase
MSRAALYLRVSTPRQAEKDLSIPDQRRQLEAWGRQHSFDVVAEYVEPGASATDDRRPQFQRMMEDATRRDRPFDAILVHSFSRFFRDSFLFELHRRSLEKSGVALISITQTVSEDSAGKMSRQLMSIFDEYQSRENAKHVIRAMKENARQGYWNGSQPPFGYKAVAVETRADAVKKRLVIDPVESEIVREVFKLYLEGNGVRAIAARMNRKNIPYRDGKFTSALTHKILTREAYIGRHYFNRTDSRAKKVKARSEWVWFETPTIIDPDVFQTVQDRLASRRPTRTPPRVVNSPTLLTGIAKCAICGGGMTIRTGKSGRYRYYACNNRINKGSSTCRGLSIRMEHLDDIVVHELESRISQPDRIKALLAGLIERQRNRGGDQAQRSQELRLQLREVESKINRLLDAIQEGLTQETDLVRDRLTRLEQERSEILRLIASLEHRQNVPPNLLSQKNVRAFERVFKERLRSEDGSLRKAYIRQLVDKIEVSQQEIRISGSQAALAKCVVGAARGASEAGRAAGRCSLHAARAGCWRYQKSCST